MMNSYLIESLAPLVFRSGKPFASQSSAQDVIFPLPSAVAGLVRATAIAQKKVDFDKNRCGIDDPDYKKVLDIKSQGIYLTRVNQNSIDILVPKPANALYVEDKEQKGKIDLVRLAPADIEPDCGSDLPKSLQYVQTVDINGKPISIKGKPKSGVNFWHIDDLIKWQNNKPLTYDDIKNNGLASIPTNIRTHVAIDDMTDSSEDGKLFQTASFDLSYQREDKVFEEHRLGFVILSEQTLDDDMVAFGGERRLSYFKSIKSDVGFIKPSQALLDSINQAGGFSLTFLTPCVFAKGYLPSWIDENTMTGELPDSKVKVQLQAVAVERFQAVSGWDSLLWQPKATRKAVPAGSVYWFKCSDKLDIPTLQRLCQSLADDRYDQNDGFGMTLIAPFTI